jgi:hypothetical protein
MRAAIYARYSSELQSASSAEDQIAICKERVVREDGPRPVSFWMRPSPAPVCFAPATRTCCRSRAQAAAMWWWRRRSIASAATRSMWRPCLSR